MKEDTNKMKCVCNHSNVETDCYPIIRCACPVHYGTGKPFIPAETPMVESKEENDEGAVTHYILPGINSSTYQPELYKDLEKKCECKFYHHNECPLFLSNEDNIVEVSIPPTEGSTEWKMRLKDEVYKDFKDINPGHLYRWTHHFISNLLEEKAKQVENIDKENHQCGFNDGINNCDCFNQALEQSLKILRK